LHISQHEPALGVGVTSTNAAASILRELRRPEELQHF
jgi:hypothetical protein